MFKKLSFTKIPGIESALIRINLKLHTENWNYLTFLWSKNYLLCLASSLLNTTHFSKQNITKKRNRSENLRHSGCLLFLDVINEQFIGCSDFIILSEMFTALIKHCSICFSSKVHHLSRSFDMGAKRTSTQPKPRLAEQSLISWPSRFRKKAGIGIFLGWQKKQQLM